LGPSQAAALALQSALESAQPPELSA